MHSYLQRSFSCWHLTCAVTLYVTQTNSHPVQMQQQWTLPPQFVCLTWLDQNTMFRLPTSRHWHLIDYIVTMVKDRQDVHLTKDMCGADNWMDHCLIIATLNFIIQLREGHRGRKLLRNYTKPNLNAPRQLRNCSWTWTVNSGTSGVLWQQRSGAVGFLQGYSPLRYPESSWSCHQTPPGLVWREWQWDQNPTGRKTLLALVLPEQPLQRV